jgi:hypothetical protein
LTDHPKTTGSTAFIGGGHANVIKSLSISNQSSPRLSNPPPASAKQTKPLSAGRKAQLTILKRAMGFHRSLPNSSQPTLLKLKEARFRDGRWPNAKLFMFPMYWPIPNTLNVAQTIAGFRTLLGVPMLREGVPIGVITLAQYSVRHSTRGKLSWW